MTSNSSEFGPATADITAFHQIARALTSSLDLEAILVTIMRQIGRFFHPETWTVLLTDDQRKDLYCVVADGHFDRQITEMRIPIGEGIAGQVAEQGKAVILPRVEPRKAVSKTFAGHLGSKIRSFVCIPLRSRHKTLGVIQLFNLPEDAFSEPSIATLTVLSDFAAIAIENARAFQRVQDLTILDECTGLYNLRHFDRSLRQEISRCDRFSAPMSIIFIDLDDFKLVNDRFGHQTGSYLLAEFSATLKSQVRSVDQCFRYGGDEFVVLLPGTDKRAAVKVAERILTTMRKAGYTTPAALSLNIRASMGIAGYPEDGASGQEILEAADARMYRVKDTTGDGYCGFDEEASQQRPA